MKTGNLLVTTALATLLAGPVLAQQSDTTMDGTTMSESGIGSFSVGEFLGRMVVASDGSDAGQVEAVVEGFNGAQVLVALDDKTVALPLDAFSVAEDGRSLAIDRDMNALQDMAAFESSGERSLDLNTAVADLLGEGPSQQSETTEMAEGEETPATGLQLETPEMAEGGAPGLTDDGIGASEMAEGDETPATGLQLETPDMAEGGAPGLTDDGIGATQMAEGDETPSNAQQTDMDQTDMADAGSGTTGGAGNIGDFAGMTIGEVLGMQVIAADGNDVGEIDYVYQSAEGYMAVIGIGGFLGIGEHTVSVPLGDFFVDRQQNALILEGRTEEELDAMQEVDETGLESLPDDHTIES